MHKDAPPPPPPPVDLSAERTKRLRERTPREGLIDLQLFICNCSNYRNWLLHGNGEIECGECGCLSANLRVVDRREKA